MAYIGSCPDMCPETERHTRFGLYMSIFEKDQQNQPDEYAMVKEYRRSGADQEEPLPQDLRTPKALKITMDYLICNIMDDSRSTSQELALDWYDFLWDRLRAVRKDITQQNICDQASAILVERCARFHVHSCYAMNRVKDFDVDMNKRNLNDCLQMLRQMYTDLKTTTSSNCPGELEFQKYDILLHLNEDHLSSNVLMKTSDHRSSNEMKFIIRIFNAYTNNDYYGFFKLMQQADYMTSCILSLYANKVRLTGLKIIVAACTRQATLYPFELAIQSLGFDGPEDLQEFALKLGIEIQEKDFKHYLVLNKELNASIRKSNSLLSPFKSSRMVENKMQGRLVGQLIYGRPDLPENPYRRFPQRRTEEQQVDEDWLEDKYQQQDLSGQEDVEMAPDGGRAPRFRRRLEDKTVLIEDSESVCTEELIVSTEKDEWSRSRDELDIRWFVDGKEITRGFRQSDELVDSYEIENFFAESNDEWLHKLIIKWRKSSTTSGDSSRRKSYSCRASNKFGETETSNQVKWFQQPRFLGTLEDVKTSVGETITRQVTVDKESGELDDLRFSRDAKSIYSSKSDSDQRDVTTPSGSRIAVRSFEETLKKEEEIGTGTRYAKRYSRSGGQKRQRRGKTYEVRIENVQIDQQGTWECQAVNEAGETSCKADVEVFAEPKIVTDLPEAVRIAPGKEIRLHVEASGSPIPVYSWFKDDLGIAEEQDRVFTETKSTTTTRSRLSSVTSLRTDDGINISGETLVIKDIRPEDAGMYSCRLENRLGQVQSRKCKLVIIEYGDDLRGPPKIIQDFSRDQLLEIDEDESILMKVPADGQPRLIQQHWFKDTEEIVDRASRFELEQEGRVRRKKAKMGKDEIAKLMPVGRFKQCSLATKIPTLKMPPPPSPQVPTKRRKSNEGKKILESIRMCIDDEDKANKILTHLSSIFY